ncbi:hypothetical protein GCM10009737_08390 [Nocardioides lentus]|uniref:DUF3188 domain-containing protein n=1 Tax=Nocardioides lentus TaxID=338077 RepID=A0ABN2P1A5_9ACTN
MSDEQSFIPRRLYLAGFLVVLGLLVLAVAVGLIRNQINVDGLIIALMPVVTGVLLGGAIRGRSSGGKDGDQ